MQNILCLTGVTGTGKTDIALELSEKFPIEIISMDSAMVFRDLNIGTDTPEESILKKVPHHLISIISPKEYFSAGHFILECKKKIQEIQRRNKIPLIVGGTLMYLNALILGLANLPERNQKVRNLIHQLAEKYSWQFMYEFLCFIDPLHASKISINDHQRIERSLEVFLISEKNLSSFHHEQASENRNNFEIIAIERFNKEEHHRKISMRVHAMVKKGIVDELEFAINKYDLSLTDASMKLIGYKQFFQYLNDEISMNDAIEKTINSTNQLAKRQMTWLRKMKFINTRISNNEVAIQYLNEKLLKYSVIN
ncbi:MAG: tRNA (adenosine(37)-N6)-dimethylallyltransferase MiaA [Gammaproteobacteria bacterium]